MGHSPTGKHYNSIQGPPLPSLLYSHTSNPIQRKQYFFTFVLVYKALISLAKISVCLFLLRIFQSPAFRYTTYTMIAINTAVAITWILTDSFHCIPVHLAWTGWAMEDQGTCINFVASTFANGFVNIVVDTVMVIMPVYEVSRLNLSAQKKIGVAVMLGMGLVYVLSSFCSCA